MVNHISIIIIFYIIIIKIVITIQNTETLICRKDILILNEGSQEFSPNSVIEKHNVLAEIYLFVKQFYAVHILVLAFLELMALILGFIIR